MRCDKPTLRLCSGAAVLGLLAAASFADTPYPDEAGGSACYTVSMGTPKCYSPANKSCENEVGGEGGECTYCTGTVKIDDHYCAATTEEKCCDTSGETADCGAQHVGECSASGSTCVDKEEVTSTTGCGEMDVACTGTQPGACE